MANIRPAFRGRVLTDLLSRTLVVVVLILFIYGGFAYWVSKRTIDSEMGARLIAIATATSGQVKSEWVPFLSSQGQLMQDFRDFLEEQRTRNNIENMLILDTNGKVLADAREKYSFKAVYRYAEIDTQPMDSAISGRPAASILITFTDGIVYKVAYAPIFGKGGKLVAVLAVEANARFVEGLRQFANVLFFFGLVCLALAAGVVLVFGRRFVLPIKEMAQASQRIASGDYGARVKVNSPNELGALGHAFNDMAGRLEAHNEYILESMSNGLLVIDLKNRVTTFNQAAGHILDLDPAMVLSQHFEKAFERYPEFLQIVWPSLTQGKKMIETEVLLVGENPRVLNFQSSPLLGEDEKILGTEIILTDETQVKRLQAQIKSAEKLATIGQLAAGIAHEIRNPLGAMKGFTEILGKKLSLQTGIPAEATEMVADIGKEIEILNKIVTHFLIFAKPTSLELQEVDLFEAVQSTQSLVLKEAEPRGVKVDYIRRRTLSVGLDIEQFRRAVLNVALNAVQASPRGGRVEIVTDRTSTQELTEILCRDGSEEKPAGSVASFWACTFIRDEGPGIAEVHRSRMFTPFFTTKTEGFGLGLSITRKIMEAHDGGVSVLNRPDGGAEFVMYLPVLKNTEE